MNIVDVRSFKGHTHKYFYLAHSKYHISDILRILRPTLQTRFDLCIPRNAVSFLGIFVSNFRYSVYAVHFTRNCCAGDQTRNFSLKKSRQTDELTPILRYIILIPTKETNAILDQPCRKIRLPV